MNDERISITAAWLRNHVCIPREGVPEWFVKKFESENKSVSVDGGGKK